MQKQATPDIYRQKRALAIYFNKKNSQINLIMNADAQLIKQNQILFYQDQTYKKFQLKQMYDYESIPSACIISFHILNKNNTRQLIKLQLQGTYHAAQLSTFLPRFILNKKIYVWLVFNPYWPSEPI